MVLVSLLFAPRRGFLWEILKLRRDRRQLRYQRVLTTLYQLASHHADRHYRSEKRMLDTYLGADSRRALARLMARGLIIEQAPPPHEPGNNKRWVLTPAGCQEAERILATLGQEQAH